MAETVSWVWDFWRETIHLVLVLHDFARECTKTFNLKGQWHGSKKRNTRFVCEDRTYGDELTILINITIEFPAEDQK